MASSLRSVHPLLLPTISVKINPGEAPGQGEGEVEDIDGDDETLDFNMSVCAGLAVMLCHIADRADTHHGTLRSEYDRRGWLTNKLLTGPKTMEEAKESQADFTFLPVITVHKRNIAKYKQKLVHDIQVN